MEAATEIFRNNPEKFFVEVLGIDTLEDYQKDILNAVRDHDRVAIAACHDVGKSWTMARVVAWFLSTFPYSKVVTTAPTYNQVKNILWSEIRAAHARAKFPLGGKLNLTDWNVTPEGDWFALGFTPRNEISNGQGQGTQSSFQGFHAPHILVVFDEATGIPANVWTMAEGLLTSGSVKFVAIGNPTSRSSEFFNCFRSQFWHKIYLSCFDSPNLIANGVLTQQDLEKEVEIIRTLNDIEVQERIRNYKITRPHLLTLKWVITSILKWGIDHPLTVSKVLGKFPKQSDRTLLDIGWIEDSQLRVYWPAESDRKTIGVDVARFGTDHTVLTAMHGKKVTHRKTLAKRDLMEVTGEVIAMSRDIGGADILVIDETGVGGGVVDALRAAKKDRTLKFDVRGVQFGAGCQVDSDRERYVNLKARMFGLLADDLKKSDGIVLPQDSIYLEELPTILYQYDSKGRMQIESKEDYKKRTGRGSPDSADSLALANYGHYDEIAVGSFSSMSSKDYAAPFASGLGAQKKW